MPVWRLNCSGSCVELLKQQLFIGRDDDCDLTIKHKGINIRHAVLNHDQRLGVFRLTDLGSSYGTFVNGESVGEESVPLYVGTRIMFGKNPNIWCVEVVEAAVKPYIPEPATQQHAPQLQTAYHSVPPSLSSHSDLYSSPCAPSPLSSHSFQAQPPAGRSSPACTPGSCAGKSYFGDPGDSSPHLRGNESFAPVGRSVSSQVSFSDRIVSTPLSTNSCSRTSADSRPDTERFRNLTEDVSSASKESVREVSTRARTLYGQPSWWGDGSDTFSTPPSHRKYTKPDEIATPNTSTNPPSSSRIPESRYLPIDTLDRRSPVPGPSEVAKFSEERRSADSRDFRGSTKFFVSIESEEVTDPRAPLPPDQPVERENPPLERPPLVRRGSYEIPSEQLDISLSRPVIDPEPSVSTPSRGRKPEVFVVELGERSGSKKLSRTEPRLLFKEDRDIAAERLAERDTTRHKVRLAFKETEPILSTPQPPSNHIAETELDTDPELEFMTPCTRPPLDMESPQVDSLVSDRGEDIGDPVTSSTPISMTSGESQLISPPAPILLPPPFRLETEERGATPECTQKKGRRRAWNIPQQSLDPAVIQTLSDLTRSIEFNLDQANSQAGLVRGVLVKHLGSGMTPLSAPDSFEDTSHSPELETANEEIVEIVRALKRIEAKVKSYSKHYGSNMGTLHELLNKLRAAEGSDFDTPEVPTHDRGVRKGSFEAEADSVAEQLKHFSDLSYTHK